MNACQHQIRFQTDGTATRDLSESATVQMERIKSFEEKLDLNKFAIGQRPSLLKQS